MAETYDVVIAGGAAHGSSLAYHLTADPGFSVSERAFVAMPLTLIIVSSSFTIIKMLRPRSWFHGNFRR